MANRNYTQVIDLLASSVLNWKTDIIMGYLCSGAMFNATDKVFSDVVGASVVAKAPIQGRIVGVGGLLLGYPAFFEAVPSGTYQMILVQDLGLSVNLLSFFDTSGDSDPLTQSHEGTFVLRPDRVEGFDENDTTRLWMKVL
jgi:hypothetical protein